MMVFPGTLDQVRHLIQVLQQLQRLLPIEATLSDVAALLTSIEAEYGEKALLEDVIQQLVGTHLAMQVAQRGAARSICPVELEVVT
jgi:hypothetical protein